MMIMLTSVLPSNEFDIDILIDDFINCDVTYLSMRCRNHLCVSLSSILEMYGR